MRARRTPRTRIHNHAATSRTACERRAQGQWERRLHLQGLHTESISSCAFSPDGATLALVSQDNTASILNTASAPALVFAQTLLPTNQVCVSSTIHTKVLEEDGSREGEGSCVRACFRNFVNHPSTEEWSSGAKRYRRLQKQAFVHGGASGTTHAHGRYDRHSQYFEAEWLCCSHSDFPVYVSEHVRACARRGSKKFWIHRQKAQKNSPSATPLSGLCSHWPVLG